LLYRGFTLTNKAIAVNCKKPDKLSRRGLASSYK
jgi:hypothetical protein